jgi:hypothetical protein
MKVSLCFLISGKQNVNKEQLWIKWLSENKDLFNIYFHYKDYNTISSLWIKKHALPQNYIVETSYYHVVPAYMSLLNYALKLDKENQWFIFLTESCVPIISPLKFKELFLSFYDCSILNWRKPWWNVNFCKRANLKHIPQEFHFGHDPYFLLKREDAESLIKEISLNPQIFNIYKKVCQGAIANESVFAILFYILKKLETKYLINASTHATDWSRPTSPTSPHVFSSITDHNKDQQFICKFLETNKYTMFLRKVGPDFPDHLLEDIIYKDNELEERKERVWKLEWIFFLKMNTYLPALGIGLFLYFVCYLTQSLFLSLSSFLKPIP